MRLLSTTGDEIKQFLVDEDISRYAILSHTWDNNQEVSLQEWQKEHDPLLLGKTGYTKIRQAQRQGKEAGLHWIWIDT